MPEATPADAALPVAPSPAAKSKPKSKSKLPWVAMAVVLALLAAAAAGYLVHRHDAAPAPPPHTVAAGYFDLGPIVANFTTASAIHFLQADVTLMSHDPQALATAKQAAPQIRNALVLLLSGQPYATLASTQGKLRLQQEALQKVQAIVHQALGRPGIQALYFTSFVMQ